MADNQNVEREEELRQKAREARERTKRAFKEN